MRYAFRISLALCAAGAVLAADPAPPRASDKVVTHLGPPAVNVIARIESAEAFEAGKVADPPGDGATIGLRVVSMKGTPLTPAQVAQLAAVLLADDTCLRGDSKGSVAAVAFRAKTRDGGAVEVSGCLARGDVQVLVTDAAGKALKKCDARGLRDDKASAFLALAAEVFPDDPGVQKYKPVAAASDLTPAEPKPATPPVSPTEAKPSGPKLADPKSKAGPVDASAPAPAVPREYFDTPPPGWFPLHRLDDMTPWTEVQKTKDKVHLYLPAGDKPVRGVYLSVVFHTQDPRELARLWGYALVTIPWEVLYDVGLTDKRVKRGDQTKLPVGNMGWLLHYLEKAAAETKHPELATVPIVGWLMQSGGEHAPDLLKRAPDRLVAWADSFPAPIRRRPDLLANCPYVIAWEFGPADDKRRRAERALKLPAAAGKATPAPDLLCEASTYDFPHGVYSKWNLFAVFLDRCIRARVPAELPAPGQPVKVKPADREGGWCADFNDVSEWVPIAPYKEAKGMVAPVWLPDEYAAWAYRAYHSHDPDLTLTAPVTEYVSVRAGGKEGRGKCGLGFGQIEGKAGEAVTLRAGPRGQVAKDKPAAREWAYVRVEFRDGDKVLGTADKAPWTLEAVKLEPGLHALIVVGVKADGTRVCSRPALYGVR